jgi:type I restriction enzyme S subunit
MKKGWELKKLGDVCYSKSSNVSQNQLADEVGEYSIFGASGLIKNVSFYHRDKPYLSIVKDGSGFGRITKMDAFTSVIGTLQYILPNDDIDLDYLNYSLMSVDFKKYVQGAAIPHIYFKDYKNEPFLWTPLPEQQRIVAILDEAFASINKAKTNAEKNLKNAKELFESYLQGVFENKGEGWEEKKLGDVVEFFNGFAFKSKDVIESSNTQLIRMGNLYQNQLNLDRRAVFYPDDFALTYKKYLLVENDLIISLTGTTDKEDYGYTVRIPENDYNLLLNQRIAKISIKNEKTTNKDYLFHFLLSRTFLDKLYKTANGTRQANLSTETMKGLSIAIPNIEQQQTIVQKLDTLSIETQKLEAIYQQKINDLEELKKSVLQKAFSGELRSPEGAASTNDGHRPSKKALQGRNI